ncbi:Thioesterase-like superfamily protein [Streptoalloteichus tenebrarius]|uniref:Thioesterase-like superfamily protein n=1 Tax=Streptoalloteichus tenebrarius (strain ATCC 17920 / DSM 40477 / JCM 4838 / CBS 697.72 / NBRC 16177 / NCIMB 11028 / NRRL B-12390 / A12253. 1 / ISP 5477) TaxID=1933 RepID=A0ABT1I1R8_STRSD|nr:thioesterase family protein [Streptoalloteichus tenebrarius]MCP2261709.1 Thioesterase-like superfamily protein [Streptoalloteichus tenebrarius]BFF02422.1 thioesterase family protein [Streptoalloteichus tenebrarius]
MTTRSALRSASTPPPRFSSASAVRPLGDGTFTAELSAVWTIGGRPHGGYLLSVLARAALAALGGNAGGNGGRGDTAAVDPLAVSAQFLHAPEVGPVLVRTEVLRTGRTVSVVRAVLEQRGRACVDATVTAGALVDAPPAWADLPDMPAAPPARAVDVGGSTMAEVFRVARACDLRLDPDTAAFLAERTDAEPVLRMWVRPRDEEPDPLFALTAGDITPPVTFNLGRIGWSPTVQLTALLRARPSPGWLRIEARSRAVHGPWFDEDLTVVDAAGRLVCQARQLALTPAEHRPFR